MAVNKVEYNTPNGLETLIDLTEDTVTPDTLMAGYTAHAANGEQVVGTLTPPVRGVDYWTDADQEAIVQQVITALGTPVFGRVDADNNIILTGELADGSYVLKYEDGEGNVTEVGSIDIGGLPYVNQIFESIGTDGKIYNGQGWKSGYRLNSSGGETAIDGVSVTGFIPVVYGDEVRMKNIAFTAGTYVQGQRLCVYNSKFEQVLGVNSNGVADNKYWLGNYQVDEAGNLSYIKISDNSYGIAYLRVSSTTLGANSIITVNEEIV